MSVLITEGPVIIYRPGEGAAEDLGLNKVKFSRFPLLILLKWNATYLKWFPLITFDDFRDPPPPPMSSFSKQILVVPPLNPSVIPPFGFSVTTDPLFCSPKNQVIPPKIPLPHPLRDK